MDPMTAAMIASLAMSFAQGQGWLGESDAQQNVGRVSGVQADALEGLMGMRDEVQNPINAPFFQIGNKGSNLMSILPHMDFGGMREMDLLKAIAGQAQGGVSAAASQARSDAESDAYLNQQVSQLVYQMLKNKQSIPPIETVEYDPAGMGTNADGSIYYGGGS
jgi:hypothetical protein